LFDYIEEKHRGIKDKLLYIDSQFCELIIYHTQTKITLW